MIDACAAVTAVYLGTLIWQAALLRNQRQANLLLGGLQQRRGLSGSLQRARRGNGDDGRCHRHPRQEKGQETAKAGPERAATLADEIPPIGPIRPVGDIAVEFSHPGLNPGQLFRG